MFEIFIALIILSQTNYFNKIHGICICHSIKVQSLKQLIGRSIIILRPYIFRGENSEDNDLI